MNNFFHKILLPIIFICCLVIFWELYTKAHASSAIFLPAPSAIAQAFLNNWNIIFSHTSQTLLETIIGLTISVVAGLICAVALSASTTLRHIFYPLLLVTQTVPMIVLSPLFLLWFGFGLAPKVIIVVLYCIFPIIIATTDALVNVDVNLLNLLKSMNASRWQILKYVRLPSIWPAFFSGLKISVTYCFTGAIAGEFIGAERGLGVLMKLAANSHAFALLYAAILVTVLVSISLFGIIVLLEHLLFPWALQNKKHR